jgi:hypothetical protein
MTGEIKYYPEAVTRAVKRLRADGVNIKTLCAEVSNVYYTKLYDKMGKRAMVPESFLEPIMARYPIFRQYLGSGSSEEIIPAVLSDSDVPESRTEHHRLEKLEQKIDQLMDETREYRRVLESQLQINATLQKDKDSVTKELIEILKKHAK